MGQHAPASDPALAALAHEAGECMRGAGLWALARLGGKGRAVTGPRVPIVGAGFAGFHCAREVERLLRPSEAELTLTSPVDYMLHSPLLPQAVTGEVAQGDRTGPVR